jgi:hypothetical protein
MRDDAAERTAALLCIQEVTVSILDPGDGYNDFIHVRFEVRTAVNRSFMVFCLLTSCNLARVYQHFGGTCQG